MYELVVGFVNALIVRACFKMPAIYCSAVSERSAYLLPAKSGLSPFQIDWWQCMPEPLSPNSGLGMNAHLRHGGEHFGAHILRRVERRYREVSFLEADVVTEIAALVFGVGIRRKLNRIDAIGDVVRADGVFHVVEDKELGFRSEENRIADAKMKTSP